MIPLVPVSGPENHHGGIHHKCPFELLSAYPFSLVVYQLTQTISLRSKRKKGTKGKREEGYWGSTWSVLVLSLADLAFSSRFGFLRQSPFPFFLLLGSLLPLAFQCLLSLSHFLSPLFGREWPLSPYFYSTFETNVTVPHRTVHSTISLKLAGQKRAWNPRTVCVFTSMFSCA